MPSLCPLESRPVITSRIDATSYRDACDRIQAWVETQQSGYVVAANVHVVMTAFWQPDFRRVLYRAALVTPDGMPLVWALKLLGLPQANRVYGPDLMLACCARAAQHHIPIYLYGGTVPMLEALVTGLTQQFPELQIAGYYAPPFRPLTPSEMAEDAQRITQSGAKVVLVGLGCPKQEYWMAQQTDALSAILLGVGAAFSFHSGQVSQAPRWIMRIGCEWAYRLSQEPGRLWKRYLINNPVFVLLFAVQLIRHYWYVVWHRLIKHPTL